MIREAMAAGAVFFSFAGLQQDAAAYGQGAMHMPEAEVSADTQSDESLLAEYQSSERFGVVIVGAMREQRSSRFYQYGTTAVLCGLGAAALSVRQLSRQASRLRDNIFEG